MVVGLRSLNRSSSTGQSVGRPTLAYTDHYYYAVTHYRAYPQSRGASSGLRSYGGRIAGFACGADFNYETDYRGRSIQLLGNVQAINQSVALVRVQQPAHMEVRDMGGRRHFRGSVGDDIGGLFIPHDRSSKVIDFRSTRPACTVRLARACSTSAPPRTT